jgi:hypothetical protein
MLGANAGNDKRTRKALTQLSVKTAQQKIIICPSLNSYNFTVHALLCHIVPGLWKWIQIIP